MTESVTVAAAGGLSPTLAGEQPSKRKRSIRPALDQVSVTVTPIAPESPRMKALLELLFPTDETVRVG